MPTPRIITNTVDVAVHYFAGTNQMENVYQFGYVIAPSSAELLSLATEVASEIVSKQVLFTATNVFFKDIIATDIGSISGAQATYIFPPDTHGSRGGDAEPLNVASGVTLRTGLRGRSNRGRKSYSGFVESDTNGNTLGSSLVSLLADIAVQLLLPRVSGTFTPVVASLLHNNNHPIKQAVVIDNNVDSQKTRLNLRGA